MICRKPGLRIRRCVLSALLLAAEEMVTLPPVAVKTAGSVTVSLTSTLPKFSEAGEMLS